MRSASRHYTMALYFTCMAEINSVNPPKNVFFRVYRIFFFFFCHSVNVVLKSQNAIAVYLMHIEAVVCVFVLNTFFFSNKEGIIMKKN